VYGDARRQKSERQYDDQRNAGHVPQKRQNPQRIHAITPLIKYFWLFCILFFTACQPDISPTLPPTPESTPFPWIPVREGQPFLNFRQGKCLFREPISILYPTVNGGLRDALPGDMLLGASVGASPLRGVNAYNTAAAREFNMIVPEVALKFEIVHPEPGRYDFCEMDTIAAFAEANKMRLRGHPLVWEQQIPAWVGELSMPREAWVALLQNHVTQLVLRYEGKVQEWDVINEPFTEEGTFKETIWYNNVGPEYIELALQWVHEANPDAQLFINEFATENLNPKSDALYRLAQDLLARGVPLHGIGFQMHLDESNPPDPEQAAENFRRFGELGLKVAVTELDVRILKPITPEKLAHQAEIYRAMLKACLSAPDCDTFVLWGVNDGSSWIPYFYPEWGSPLILDDAFEPKPAYWALVEALQP
jgi:endo-1,4-beta-xylanase